MQFQVLRLVPVFTILALGLPVELIALVCAVVSSISIWNGDGGGAAC